jgi:hypothetical protein
VQYPKPHQQYETPTVPDGVISKLLLPQSTIMAASVDTHSSLFSDVPPDLTTYKNHNFTGVTIYSLLSPTNNQLRTLS